MITQQDITDMAPIARRMAAKFRAPGYDADDLAQEALLHLTAQAGRLNEAGETIDNWRHYASRLMKRRIIDLYRKSQVDAEYNSHGPIPEAGIYGDDGSFIKDSNLLQPWFKRGETANLAADPTPSPLDTAIEAEELTLLREALDKIEEPMIAAAMQHELDGMGLESSAKLLGTYIMHVSRLRQRGRNFLRQYLQLKGVR